MLREILSLKLPLMSGSPREPLKLNHPILKLNHPILKLNHPKSHPQTRVQMAV